MFRRAQDRVRTYYYKTKDELVKNKELPPTRLQNLLNDLQVELNRVKYFGSYFDRSYCIGDLLLHSLCNDVGTFVCEGRWDKQGCLYEPPHSINPYKSPEERIVFQTWNLDHTVERSRSVIPAICKALIEADEKKNGNKNKVSVDTKKIFDDLFSKRNLKFVHIVCHDKGAHVSKIAGPYLIY